MLEHADSGARLRAGLPVTDRVRFASREIEGGDGPAKLDELRARGLHSPARGAVGEHAHLVTTVHQLACQRELGLGIAAEGDERLEDTHDKI